MERATQVMKLVLFMLLISSTSLQHVSVARPIRGHRDGLPPIFESLKGATPSGPTGCTHDQLVSGVCPPTPP